MSTPLQAVPQMPPLEQIARRLTDELHARTRTLGDPDAQMVDVSGTYLDNVEAVARLARALRDVEAANASATASTPAPAPFDLQGMMNTAWQATQDAGAPTSVGDATVQALREFIEKGPPRT